jgi:hypothetical protein
MGTLFDQPPRKSYSVSDQAAKNKLQQIKKFCTANNISFEEAIKLFEMLEYSRRTDVIVSSGDIHDEQLHGLGNLIQSFIDKVDFMAKIMEEKL